eukprot:4893243-Prorocentrum_lima.AAC.1
MSGWSEGWLEGWIALKATERTATMFTSRMFRYQTTSYAKKVPTSNRAVKSLAKRRRGRGRRPQSSSSS